MAAKPKVIRVELNANMDCSAACPNCDRGVAEFPDRTDWMTVEDIERLLLRQLRERRGEVQVERLKWVGGEPLVHPEFRMIYGLLCNAVDEGLIEYMHISTNCVSKIPDDIARHPHPKVRWKRSPLRAKQHLPFYWHPEDVGQPTHGFCSHPRKCGMSLSVDGWLPCSPAVLIAGAFDLEHLFRQEVPTEPWGVELCSNCVYSTPRDYRKGLLEKHPFEFTSTTEKWEEGLQNYARKTGQRVKLPAGPAPQLVEIGGP